MSTAALGAPTDPSAATESPDASQSRPSSQPAAGDSSGAFGSRFEGLPILDQGPAPSPDGEVEPGSGIGDNLAGTAMSLLLVVGLIVVGLWVLRRLFPQMRGGKSDGPMTVLSKHHLSPKQQLFLVKIGSRLVVVGAAGGALSAVCEITDPDEIAELSKQCEQKSAGSITGSFRSLFVGSRGQMADALAEDVDADGDADDGVGEVREELDSTVGRLRRFLSSRRRDA